jgi:hypothetical protein
MAWAGVSIAAGWDAGEGWQMIFPEGFATEAQRAQSGNRLPRGAGWPIVNDVARVAQLDRALASEAEG